MCTFKNHFIGCLGIMAALAFTGFSDLLPHSNLCSLESSPDDVYLSDPDDCSLYYICRDKEEYAAKCPVGFHYNKETIHCDLPENVNCNTATDSLGLEGVSIISPAPGFDCPGDGKWPHETACEKFYECTGFEANLGICTQGMLFDLRYNDCNFPEGVDCGDRNRPTDIPGTLTPTPSTTGISTISTTTPITTTTTTERTTTTPRTTTTLVTETPDTEDPINVTTTTPEITQGPTKTEAPTTITGFTTPQYDFECPRPDGNFADPLDCTAFYNCLNGDVIGHQFCPEDLLFNPILENCDYPWNVDCNVPRVEFYKKIPKAVAFN